MRTVIHITGRFKEVSEDDKIANKKVNARAKIENHEESATKATSVRTQIVRELQAPYFSIGVGCSVCQ